MASRVEEIIEERRQTDDSISSDKTKKRHVFRFSWEAPRGEKYEGVFVNRILTTGDRADVEALASQYVGGVPWESINPDRRRMVEMLAHLTVSLEGGSERPKWSNNLGTIIDEDVIILMFEEVSSHEEIFRRPKKDTERGQDDNGGREGSEDA
jgi:hypothetical protein